MPPERTLDLLTLGYYILSMHWLGLHPLAGLLEHSRDNFLCFIFSKIFPMKKVRLLIEHVPEALDGRSRFLPG